jgi:hypothetical protein
VVGGSAGSPYNLQFTPKSVNAGIYPTLVLGENGTAFAAATTTTTDGTDTNLSQLVSFNIDSGANNWTYQAPSQNTISIITVSQGNGLVAKITDQNGNETVARFDSSGSVSFDPWSASHVDYFVAGMSWLGTLPGSNTVSTFSAPSVTLSPETYDQPHGNGANNAPAAYTLFDHSDPNHPVNTFSQTGSHQATLTTVYQRVASALPLYNSCNNWLRGPSVTGLQQIQTELNDGTGATEFGHANIYAFYSPYAQNRTTAAFTGGLNPKPPGEIVPGLEQVSVVTVFNDAGFFFNPDDGQGHTWNNITARHYSGNSPQIQNLTVLHELAHAVHVPGFAEDNGRQDLVDANNLLVDQHCRGLVEGPNIKKLSPNSGPAGTTVTISGQNFGDTTSSVSTVTFNSGIVANVVSWSDQTIVVTVPPNATTGNVIVTVSQQSSKGKQFTVK